MTRSVRRAHWLPLPLRTSRRARAFVRALALIATGLAAAGLVATRPGARAAGSGREHRVSERLHHLGDSDHADWRSFTTEAPEHLRRVAIEFDCPRPESWRSLELTAGDVRETWSVRLNGQTLGTLEKRRRERTNRFDAEGLLRRRGNDLVVEAGRKSTDDIWVGRVVLRAEAVEEAEGRGRLLVRVRDAGTGGPLPCRITVVHADGRDDGDGGKRSPPELRTRPSRDLAVRRGLVYSLSGSVDILVDPGRYRVWASRGPEYSAAKGEADVGPGERETVELEIRREVDTEGYLAADTHIHTLTYSGHGDATVEERVVTIAGEGVELAVATDHDHHTDYSALAGAIGADRYYRSIPGNEFSPGLGHFNAFPVDPRSPPADHDGLGEWTRLLLALRATPGVRVVICNHPHRRGFRKGPLGAIGLDRLSGETALPRESLAVDGIEVLNGKSLTSDPFAVFRDWFALLNRGQRIAAVAGSDSHTVKGIVGQARTYVRSSVDDPRRIRVDEVVDSFLAGRLLVSLGLFVDATIDGRAAGETVVAPDGRVKVVVEVRGPRWARADRLTLWLDGERVHDERIRSRSDSVVKHRCEVEIRLPPHDGWLVVAATGPPVTAPFWPLEDDDRYVLGATNPIWIDRDGDGRYRSPRETAERLVALRAGDLDALARDLRASDGAVRVQAASILHAAARRDVRRAYERALEAARSRVRRLADEVGADEDSALGRYLRSAPPLEIDGPQGADR